MQCRPTRWPTVFLVPDSTTVMLYCSAPPIRASIRFNEHRTTRRGSWTMSPYGGCADSDSTRTTFYVAFTGCWYEDESSTGSRRCATKAAASTGWATSRHSWVLAPNALSRLLRATTQDPLAGVPSRTKTSSHRFSCTAQQVWHNLPASIESFQMQLKTHL